MPITKKEAIRAVQIIGLVHSKSSGSHVTCGNISVAIDIPPKVATPARTKARIIAKNAINNGNISIRKKNISKAFKQPVALLSFFTGSFLFTSESDTTCSLIFSGFTSRPCILSLSSGVLASGTVIQMKI